MPTSTTTMTMMTTKRTGSRTSTGRCWPTSIRTSAARTRAAPPQPPRDPGPQSAAEEDLQDGAVLHPVGLRLRPDPARLPRLRHRADAQQVLVGDGLGA